MRGYDIKISEIDGRAREVHKPLSSKNYTLVDALGNTYYVTMLDTDDMAIVCNKIERGEVMTLPDRLLNMKQVVHVTLTPEPVDLNPEG